MENRASQKEADCRKKISQPMSDGTPTEPRCDDSLNGGDNEKKESKNEEEAYNRNNSQNMAHGTPQEPPDDQGNSVVVIGGDDDSCSNASSSSASSMAKGLSTFISSVMEDYDSRAEATISSQNQLTFALDRLTGGDSFAQ